MNLEPLYSQLKDLQTLLFQCFGKKAKKASPEEGQIPVQHEANFHSNKNNISRVGNAYINSDNVIVSHSLMCNLTDSSCLGGQIGGRCSG